MRTKLVVQAFCVQILLAGSVVQTWAACLNPPVSAQSIADFKSAPQALVSPNSDARTVETVTRDLAGSDASLAAELVGVAKGTTPRFQTAIAAGLAQAAIACANVDQQAALLIQQAVAGFQDGQFQASFAAVAGDLSTAATAAAATFAASSAGSVVVVNPNVSPRPTRAVGGSGVSALFQLTSPDSTVNLNGTSSTAASPVSATN